MMTISEHFKLPVLVPWHRICLSIKKMAHKNLKQIGFADYAQRYQMALNTFSIHQARTTPAPSQHD